MTVSRLLVAALLCSCLFAGCGGSDSSSSKPKPAKPKTFTDCLKSEGLSVQRRDRDLLRISDDAGTGFYNVHEFPSSAKAVAFTKPLEIDYVRRGQRVATPAVQPSEELTSGVRQCLATGAAPAKEKPTPKPPPEPEPEPPPPEPEAEPEPPEPQPEPENCDSNYSGCVPPYPPDVNCPDVDGPVTVTGEDPHGLDRDGDGSACE